VSEAAHPAGALAGFTVIDFGQMVSGPFCAKLFADYGAEVIKVEPPEGDVARRVGPYPADRRHPECSGLYFINNTNKRAVVCDVAIEAGRELFLRLLAKADVLIENNLPAQMRAWGLDYPRLAAANPDLVVISITPFGQTGPYSEWKGYDLNAFHLTAAGSRYCGRPGEMPLEHGTFSADYFGAVAGAAWGLAAVFGRGLVGGGQHVDVSCAEAIAATFIGGQNIGGYAQDGRFDRRTGVGMAQAAPATILPCRDGHVWILTIEQGQWQGLCRAMGSPEWASLEMFNDRQVRAENADILYSFIRDWTMQHDKMEIMEKCQAEGCPITAVYTVEEVVQQPHLAARGHFVDVEHPLLGTVRTLGAPFRLPACPGGPRRPAPLLGEHGEEIWGAFLGLSADERALLRAQRVI
jgi:crotonobetainyl-CoA:carnitine CoA-transferase CaiB-like acyl-CoA transferase